MAEKEEILNNNAGSDEKGCGEVSAKKDSFAIYNYFKEHTGSLVTCVSATVAVITFAINYANNRYDVAYLDHWNISGIYSTAYRTNFYTVLWSFLYCVAILIIHALLSGTSDEFRYYNQFLSVIKWEYKELRGTKRELRLIERAYRILLRNKKTRGEEAKRLNELGEKIKAQKRKISSMMKNVNEAESVRKRCNKWIAFNIIESIVVSFFVGVVFSLLSIKLISLKNIISSSVSVLTIIVFDMLLYFLPAYFSTRCTQKSIDKVDFEKLIKESEKLEEHNFPLEKLLGNNKLAVSDSKIKLILIQLIASMILFVVLISLSGTTAAQKQTQFPIYKDDQGAYAVIYNTGDALILESACIEDERITIDTSRQRVLKFDDISYQLITFEYVETIDVGGEE